MAAPNPAPPTGTGLAATIYQDLRATVDAGRRTGIRFWVWIFGRAAFAPQVHAVMLFRIAQRLYRTPLTPLAFVLRGLGMVWSGAELHPAAVVGPGLMVVHSSGAIIAADVRVGRNLRLHQGATIGGTRLTEFPDATKPAVIGDDVWVGANAMILMGCRVGDRAIIGANSVVSSDVPAGAIVSGIPAKVVRMRGD